MTPEAALRILAAEYAPDEAEAFGDSVMRRYYWRLGRSGKTCARCREVLPGSAFGPDGSRVDGLAPRCRPCAAAAVRESRARRLSMKHGPGPL